MGTEKAFEPGKLIMGLLLSKEAPWEAEERVYEELAARFGDIDFTSEPLPFDFTDYYKPEMGEGITRKFISFAAPADPAALSDAKIFTNELEGRLSRDGRRIINIDPGILSLSRLILASTKDNAHRIPLARGIYGEITLLYRRGRYEALPWTYPDYRTPAYHDILLTIRKLLKDRR